MGVTESDIIAMGMGFAKQGAQLGMTEAQIMGLAGTMSSLGIQADTGGAAMTTVLQKFKKLSVMVERAYLVLQKQQICRVLILKRHSRRTLFQH